MYKSYPQVIHKLSTGYPQLFFLKIYRPTGAFQWPKGKLSTILASPIIILNLINLILIKIIIVQKQIGWKCQTSKRKAACNAKVPFLFLFAILETLSNRRIKIGIS